MDVTITQLRKLPGRTFDLAFTVGGRAYRTRATLAPSRHSVHFHDPGADAALFATGRAARRVVDVLLRAHQTRVPRLPRTIPGDTAAPAAPKSPRTLRGPSRKGRLAVA